jgi:hypothetical protein
MPFVEVTSTAKQPEPGFLRARVFLLQKRLVPLDVVLLWRRENAFLFLRHYRSIPRKMEMPSHPHPSSTKKNNMLSGFTSALIAPK